MDCQTYRASSLPWIWAVEILACSNQIDVSLLLGLLDMTPGISNDIGRNARELVSLKVLENLFIQGARANFMSPSLSEIISLDPSDRCEDVLRRIMSKISLQHLKSCGLEVSKWDLEPFIEHKRSNLPKCALKKLKDAILEGSHSILASLKEQSGLPVGNHAERESPVKDGNCNGITPRVAGSDANDNLLLPTDLPDQNSVRVNRKRRATSDTSIEELCAKYKYDIISTEQHQADKSISFVLGKKSRVGSMERSEPFKEDNNASTSSKGLVDPDEVLPGEKRAARCVAELSDDPEEQGQNRDVEEAKDDKKGFSDLKRANDGNNDDMIGIPRMENASFGPEDSVTATCRDQNLLAGTSKIYSGEERCIMEKTARVEVIGENGHSGDGNNQCTSSMGIVGNDEVPHEKQAPHCSTQVSYQNSDLEIPNSKGENAENVRKGFIPIIVPTGGEAEAEDLDKSNDDDGYQEERTNIDTKKRIFLSSQCAYSQDSLATTDMRELHLCMKCNSGGELLSCSSDSCPLVIHERCLGSNASFDSTGKFYCPFCAYSRAISKYMEVKEKVSLSRKGFESFICLEPRLKSKEHSEKSFGTEGNHLQESDDLLKSTEPNQRDGIEKAINHQQRKKVSELHSGQKTVGSTKRLAQSLDKENQDGRSIGKMSKSDSTRIKGWKQTAALETRNSQKQKCSRSGQSSDAIKPSESSDPAKHFLRVRKQVRQNLWPAIHQMRRVRIPWTSKEEDKLKEGMKLYCGPNDKIIPWTQILEHGAGVFEKSRTTIDLKDKWRNMYKASPKAQ